MRRRTFLGALGSTAVAWPIAARAQQPVMPVIGFLHGESTGRFTTQLAGFHAGLKEGGFVEGQNLTVEYRWAESRVERLPEMAADLVRRRVAAIVALSGAQFAAKNATTTIPILFATGGDPVRLGLVANLARPGGNITGVSFFNADLTAKVMGLLHQLAPKVRTVALLFNPTVPDSARQPADAREAARTLGLDLLVLNASTDAEIEAAFATLQQGGAGALVIGGDPFFASRLDQLAALTQRHRIPATYVRREFPDASGLMSYGTSGVDAHRQLGVYTTRILKGEKPADLPVMQPTKFEFVINLKTAKALGLTISRDMMLVADEVIE
jgi:putative ABC transport system substrate-binding protein